MTSEWEQITDGLGTEQAPYWVNTFNDNAISYDGGETYFLMNEPLQPDGSPTMYGVESRPVPDKEDPLSLEQAVAIAVGTGSVCWESMAGTGVFDDALAKKACDDLVKWVNENYDKKENPSA
jgi:hypothetical protein